MSGAPVAMRAASKQWGAFLALSGLDLVLRPGEVLGLLGHNGAGKSTTMKLILGLYPPSSGEVRVFGEAPTSPRGREGRGRLGYLPENVSFYEQLCGREVLAYFARLKRAPRRQVAELLERVGLADFAGQRVRTYSKGMRQRLGLAQALLGEPELLLLDEPTVGLDPIATQELYRMLEEHRRRGAAILLCSHVLPGIEPYIDRAMILSRGRVLACGPLDELRRQAGLPARLRVHGELAEDTAWLPDVRCQRESDRAWALELTEESKLATLRQVLAQHPDDLWLENPSLEDLYVHFNRQAEAS
ncbi:ABC transporter ATP-binding protein [Pseudomonas schmalbachii]|uniref:ABC transporter ATP-binding protein n=1 Tax=Pseudomonas schmalbachii TaxID=2816993 RepID=A0ABS3TLX8_9PSED|nr:ABC transporter ATP-binding protein [Pseudomonas schmalbachii]MBO3274403.1 ABC transporter ATP-binding protein [Pseudomonas schmalbachii]